MVLRSTQKFDIAPYSKDEDFISKVFCWIYLNFKGQFESSHTYKWTVL